MSTDAWVPFRPTPQDLTRITADVAEVSAIQRRMVSNCPALHGNDRVAHQYQLAGSKVILRIANDLPEALGGLGLFQPGTEHHGVARISTGLGTTHDEAQPDFLGLMTAFRTNAGRRVDLLSINDPTAPTNNHRDFVSVLYATAESAGRQWIAQQRDFGLALKRRIGWIKAGETIAHIVKQTLRTFHSSTAYQTYWTGIVEARGRAGKFTFVPTHDGNHRPGLRPGDRHLSQEWRERQRAGDVEFALYWIPFLDQSRTPTTTLTQPWLETHKQRVGTVVLPRTDPESEPARLWAALASAMGANPGNWIADDSDAVTEPATEFGTARKIAYQISQTGRNALDPRMYESVFSTGEIDPDLARELLRRSRDDR
jgi:hypothetical protein